MPSMTDELPPVDAATAQIVKEWSRRPKPAAKRPIPNKRGPAPHNEAHRAAALQRYWTDQTMLEEVKARRRMLKYRGRRDVRWMFTWAGRLIKAYDMVTAFVGSHLGGPVSRACRDRRAMY